MAENNKDESTQRFMRISDVVKEPMKTLPHIDDYEDVPLVPLEIAVEPLISFMPKIESYASTAKNRCKKSPPDGLTIDESASIMLYTMGWKPIDRCLHVALNVALRSEDRKKLEPWSLYLKTFLTALSKIPSEHKRVFRGAKSDLHNYYSKGETIVWWGFSSCTISIDVLQSDGFVGTTGTRTMFTIQCESGRDISKHSYFLQEEEIIIMAPSQFTVVSCLDEGNGLFTIQLKETKVSHLLPKPAYDLPTSKKTYSKESETHYGRLTENNSKYSYGGICNLIEHDSTHANKYEHPEFCRDGGRCENMDAEHLKTYRHLPLCKYRRECVDFIRGSIEHCKAYRHCMRMCRYGHFCVKFHDEKHLSEENHPFQPPCPFTPFHCREYNSLCDASNSRSLPIDVQKHCLQYSHVCLYGRQCNEKADIHWKTTIHVARKICSFGDNCTKLDQDVHLNSFSHPDIADIRRLCPYAAYDCRDKRKLDHIKKCRHRGNYDHSGVISCFGQNKEINFVENQDRIIQAIRKYANSLNPNNTLSISTEIQQWIKGLQPVHRCSKIIFESILVHGHVMSRDHMENLKNPQFVAHAAQEHKRIRAIFDRYKMPAIEEHVKAYILAIVSLEYSKKQSGSSGSAGGGGDGGGSKPLIAAGANDYYDTKSKKERIFQSLITTEEVEIIKKCAINIADASWNLYNAPSGIGYSNDKELGTDKHVFSILGPHLGHYYGDIFLVFKSEVMFHPDANFSPQAATSFMSGRTFSQRPWSNDPTTPVERVKYFHGSKLHCSVPGYEYAAAAELIAISGLPRKTMNVDLKTILNRWTAVDSHQLFEAHLPKLVPLDYIEEVYIPKNLFASLTSTAQEAAQKVFRDSLHIVNQDIDLNDSGGTGPWPTETSRSAYQKYVINELTKKFDKRKENEQHFRGTVLTLAPSQFTDHIVLPLTVNYAYKQYLRIHKHSSHDDDVYIYWEALYGDMMITLSDEPINPHVSQPHIRCLVCYIAERPSTKTSNYNESYSYLNAGEPFRHGVIKTDGRCSASSRTFHRGCNLEDFLTFCLKIEKKTGQITLSHAGPNSIYCYETITCQFPKILLDLNKLVYIHLSAGSQKVAVRNLIISFEQILDLHPSFDTRFKRGDDSFSCSKTSSHTDRITSSKTSSWPTEEDRSKTSRSVCAVSDNLDYSTTDRKLEPCQYSINCRLQESTEHTRKCSHPCPFAELCRNKDKEHHLTHELRHVELCPHIGSCLKLADPFHRAKYRHTGYADFLIPCSDTVNCRNKTMEHRIKYSHGEQIDVTEYFSNDTIHQSTSKSRSDHREADNTHPGVYDQRTACGYGSGCRDQYDKYHNSKYSHSSECKYQPSTISHIIKRKPCRYGRNCWDINDSQHCSQFSHSKDE